MYLYLSLYIYLYMCTSPVVDACLLPSSVAAEVEEAPRKKADTNQKRHAMSWAQKAAATQEHAALI